MIPLLITTTHSLIHHQPPREWITQATTVLPDLPTTAPLLRTNAAAVAPSASAADRAALRPARTLWTPNECHACKHYLWNTAPIMENVISCQRNTQIGII
ncbi:hypothetical protein E2C01_066690 [Portunus trituberculatus]|uniref:Uncharacterized protein n=1 Tax=Portunus trituberculatus TaxID=210409 RepID=A0A5B7HRB8_PORTR|nr:hypothetical protein [Portunus trituberculatus]